MKFTKCTDNKISVTYINISIIDFDLGFQLFIEVLSICVKYLNNKNLYN